MLELGAWNRVLFNLRRLRSNLVGWQGWSVSRIKFCDTAKPALLSAANVRKEICEIRAIRGQILFGFRSSNFGISLVLGGWSLELSHPQEGGNLA